MKLFGAVPVIFREASTVHWVATPVVGSVPISVPPADSDGSRAVPSGPTTACHVTRSARIGSPPDASAAPVEPGPSVHAQLARYEADACAADSCGGGTLTGLPDRRRMMPDA